ncbi:MAG: UDP-N-acetylmuramoyl-L-alanine--D-glutamate ligase [Arcanobacterium sp.]|nr:UDP-N-acetylmuramoyl-L-alanine--D-glutamate ligase [Arcanobacterium sp.]
MIKEIPGAKDLAEKRVAVLGLGISGRAAITALTTHTTAIISAWDARETALAEYLENDSIDTAFAAKDSQELLKNLLAWKPEIVVIAPGFRESGPEWKALRESGVQVWSEIELAWHLRVFTDGIPAPWLAITGTNGKTTTVTMLESILQAAGLNGKAVGNVGTPAVLVTSDLTDSAPKAFAFELSSFQLAATHSMQATAAICLNFDDDHLEWHFSRESYAQAKGHIYDGVQRACVFPIGDSVVQKMVDNADVVAGARAIGLVLGTPSVGEIGLIEVERDVDGDGNNETEVLVVDRAFPSARYNDALELFKMSDILHLAPAASEFPLHILKDAMAAAALARAIDVSPEEIRSGLQNFSAGSHRIELISEYAGVRWINDSKATNAHAAKASLLAQPAQSTIWIAGGQAKGGTFTELVTQVKDVLKAVIVIGTEPEPWVEALSEINLPVHFVDGDAIDPMPEAISKAAEFAAVGDTVLLAPACASLDQYDSYAARGEAFVRSVQTLAENNSQETLHSFIDSVEEK